MLKWTPSRGTSWPENRESAHTSICRLCRVKIVLSIFVQQKCVFVLQRTFWFVEYWPDTWHVNRQIYADWVLSSRDGWLEHIPQLQRRGAKSPLVHQEFSQTGHRRGEDWNQAIIHSEYHSAMFLCFVCFSFLFCLQFCLHGHSCLSVNS